MKTESLKRTVENFEMCYINKKYIYYYFTINYTINSGQGPGTNYSY